MIQGRMRPYVIVIIECIFDDYFSLIEIIDFIDPDIIRNHEKPYLASAI
jgi:hypothetical protein